MQKQKTKQPDYRNKKNKIKVQDNQVLDTAGGEIPDPPKMPSNTKFNSDTKKKF